MGAVGARLTRHALPVPGYCATAGARLAAFPPAWPVPREALLSRECASSSPAFAPGYRTTLGALSQHQKSQLMKGVSSQHALVVARTLDQVSSCLNSGAVLHTDFLTPPCQEQVLLVLRRLPGLSAVLSGGFQEAERCRVSFGPPEAMAAPRSPRAESLASTVAAAVKGKHPDNAEAVELQNQLENRTGLPEAVAVCRVQFSSSRAAAVRGLSHGDFLGAVLGCGIAREKVGDIVLMEEVQGLSPKASPSASGAFIILVPELQEYLKVSLTNVGRVEVEVVSACVDEIQVRPQRVTQLRTVEASLRLDAVGSAGFRISRSKFSDLISAGKVRLNWSEDIKCGSQVGSGDVISVRGMGRCKVGDITGTKKGRMAIELVRYHS